MGPIYAVMYAVIQRERSKAMAIAFLIEVPGLTQEQGEALLREVVPDRKPPAGQILHIEGPMEGGGLRVVDVWESEEAFTTFIRDQLMPAVQRLGIPFPENLMPTAAWSVSAVLK